MDDWQTEEMRALVRAAVTAHPEVASVAPGPRSFELTLTLKDGRMRVIGIAVRDNI